MRKLNNIEKNILSKIVDNQNFIPNIIDEYLEGAKIIVYKNEKKVIYNIDVHDKMNIKDDESQIIISKTNFITSVIITLIELLNYLRKNELIQLRSSGIKEDKMTFGRGISYKNGIKNNDFIEYELEKALTNKFIGYCYKSILTTTELTSYVQSGFLTQEEINYKKEEERQQKNHEINLRNIDTAKESLKLTRDSVVSSRFVAGIAALSLLANILFNFIGKVNIDDEQLDKLLDKFSDIDRSIDSLRYKGDTIEAHIFSIEDSVNTSLQISNETTYLHEKKIQPQNLRLKTVTKKKIAY